MEMQKETIKADGGNPRMRIVTDISLWNVLLQGVSTQKRHKFTRAEAFYDLIQRERIARITGEQHFACESILSHAKTWGWDRSTVVRFICELEKTGAVSVQTDGYKKFARLSNILVSEKPAEAV